MNPSFHFVATLFAAALVGIFSGCTTTSQQSYQAPIPAAPTVRVARVSPATSLMRQTFATGKSLTVGVAVPDQSDGVSALLVPCNLRKTLEDSGSWGDTGLAPVSAKNSFDLWVTPSLERDDGRYYRLHVKAVGADGRVWLDKRYGYTLQENDLATQGRERDAFQPLYNAIANELTRQRSGLGTNEVQRIQAIRTVRRGADYSPGFQRFFETSGNRVELIGFPAEDDETYKILKDQEDIEYTFFEDLSTLFDDHFSSMSSSLGEYRRVLYQASLKQEALQEAEDTLKQQQANLAQEQDSLESQIVALELLILLGNAAKVKELKYFKGMMRKTIAASQKKIEAAAKSLQDTQEQLNQVEAQTHVVKNNLRAHHANWSKQSHPIQVLIQGKTQTLSGSVSEKHAALRKTLVAIHKLENGEAGPQAGDVSRVQ